MSDRKRKRKGSVELRTGKCSMVSPHDPHVWVLAGESIYCEGRTAPAPGEVVEWTLTPIPTPSPRTAQGGYIPGPEMSKFQQHWREAHRDDPPEVVVPLPGSVELADTLTMLDENQQLIAELRRLEALYGPGRVVRCARSMWPGAADAAEQEDPISRPPLDRPTRDLIEDAATLIRHGWCGASRAVWAYEAQRWLEVYDNHRLGRW